MYLHTKLHMPNSNGLVVITIKPKVKLRFHSDAILTSYILQKQ
jgi:hypothetical protein